MTTELLLQHSALPSRLTRAVPRSPRTSMPRANVRQADVSVLMAEFEVDKELAERKLREQRGDLTAALTAMLSS